MKIAAIQTVSCPDVSRNLDAARRLIEQAAQQGAELVALPEYFCFMSRRDEDKLQIAEEDGDGPVQRMLADTARTHEIWLIGGTVPVRTTDPAHARNTCFVHGPDGRRLARYDKIHLFNFRHGSEHYDEARVLEHGSQPVAFEGCSRAGHPFRVGLSVCYDLRFPELYRELCRPPCDLLVVPSAFTVPTGRAHWEVLLRARAIENQCHVLAPAQGGVHETGRKTYGHTLVVDGWGTVTAVLPQGEGVVMGEIDFDTTQDIRTRLPALTHRRV